MIIKIDTEKKVVFIQENTNIQDLLSQLKAMFPNGDWTEYSIAPNEVIKEVPVYYPQVPNTYPIYPYPIYPIYPNPDQPYYPSQPYYEFLYTTIC